MPANTPTPTTIESEPRRTFGRRALLAGLPAATALSSAAAFAAPAGAATTPPAGTPESTIAELRALTAAPPADLFLVTDPGMEGLFRYLPDDDSSVDDTGTTIVSAAGSRFRRVFDGPLNVRWFGARGDLASDDAAAIQTAVDTALTGTDLASGAHWRPAVYFPAGDYRIGQPIEFSRANGHLVLSGDGNATSIAPLTSAGAMAALFDLNYPGQGRQFEISAMKFVGVSADGASSAARGIHAPRIVASDFNDLTFASFSAAGLSIGQGWINNIQNCTFSNSANGIQSVAAHLNMLNIERCNFAHTDIGVNLTHGGQSVRIVGCTIEQCPKAAINLQATFKTVDIHSNYFELNATEGMAFDDPLGVVHACIIVNGPGNGTVVTSATPPGCVRIAQNFVSLGHVESPAYVVACFACYGGLDVVGNTIADTNDPRVDTVLLTGTSKTGDGARVDRLHMRANGKSWLRENLTVRQIEIRDLAGASTSLSEARIDQVYKANYAPPPTRFAPAARTTRGTWRKTTTTHRQHEVWTIGGADSGSGWGFTLSLDDNPELAGKYVYFAVWAQCSDTDTGVALSTSQLGPNTAAHAADTGWHVVSYVDQMPASGVVEFSVAKLDGTDASTVSIANPVLSEVGMPYEVY